MRHTIHAGYQRYVDSEDLERSSNGWGSLTVPGGRLSFQGTPDLLPAQRASSRRFRAVPTIHSEYQSQSIELNDTIALAQLDVQRRPAGSNDTLYGQGLKNDSSHAVGIRARDQRRPIAQYKMYEIPWSKMMQPRLGATWAYNGKDTVYASYATLQPGGQLAAARGVVGPQRRRHAQRLLRCRTASCSAPTRSARRRASCSCPT